MNKRLGSERLGSERFGTLDGVAYAVPEADCLLCLLHGYGANASDLQALAPELQSRVPRMSCLFLSAPQPCSIASAAGRQWFPLETFADNEIRQGADQSAPDVRQALLSACQRFAIPRARAMLLGFSQGGIVALHTLCCLSHPLLALVGISTTHAPFSQAMAKSVTETPVLLVHGTEDQLVPIGAGRRAADSLRKLGFSVEWHSREGMGHGIDEKSRSIVGAFLARAAASPAVRA